MVRERNTREQIIQMVLKHKIIAIVRGVYDDDCLKLAEALYKGGIRLMEVAFNQKAPESWEKTAGSIARLTGELDIGMAFGAGTVTSLPLLTLACDAGAQFIVSPDTNESVIRATIARNMVSIPGAMTATEVLTAYRYGADFVKIFPAGDMGPEYISAIRSPINHVRLLAVGGVNETNIGAFLKAGAVGVGAGGNLVNRNWIETGEFEKITALARRFIENFS